MQDFTGIAEKLKGAEENINNLYAEMDRFFKESDYPVFPENDRKSYLRAAEYHKDRDIPARFSVLAGETIHHLRSCFDHVVWHFSIGPQKNNMPVDFPVFTEKPVDKKALDRYEGKIQRITNPKVLGLIERLQPYNAADPTDDPLSLIHGFDVVDKHRELILCVTTSAIVLPREMQGDLECYQRAHPELDPAQVARHVNSHGASQPCVSFMNFGRREVKSVTEGLIKLFNYTISAIDEFRVL
jgi:hypothetical protein